MSGWLRRAGRLDLPDGSAVSWSVAEGRRGRRWHSIRRTADGALLSDLLLEVDSAGAWARLELATATGMLTLHPDPGRRSVHGNTVTSGGVRHHAFRWSADQHLAVAGEPIVALALPGGAGPGLLVGEDLAITPVAALPAIPPLDVGELEGPTWPLEEPSDPADA